MYENKKFEEMVLYIEACESGSMFDGILATNHKVYAITAANPYESSWGTYCAPNDMVNGTEINSCLGDLFSVNWMEDTERQDIKKETLELQYEIVKNLTSQSHVMKYGDLSFVKEPVGNFIGNLNLADEEKPKSEFFDKMFSRMKE